MRQRKRALYPKLSEEEIKLIIDGLECRELWGSGYALADQYRTLLFLEYGVKYEG